MYFLRFLFVGGLESQLSFINRLTAANIYSAVFSVLLVLGEEEMK